MIWKILFIIHLFILTTHINASAYVDNCVKWILKIAKDKDLTINLRHIMNFGDETFEAKILNTGDLIHNMEEFVDIAGDFV